MRLCDWNGDDLIEHFVEEAKTHLTQIDLQRNLWQSFNDFFEEHKPGKVYEFDEEFDSEKIVESKLMLSSKQTSRGLE